MVRIVSRAPKSSLSERERLVLLYTAKGMRTTEICVLLGTSQKTIETQLYRVYKFLGIESRAEAGVTAVHMGLLGPTPLEAAAAAKIDELRAELTELRAAYNALLEDAAGVRLGSDSPDAAPQLTRK